jgi:O-succinylbenzoic acid--CoA ligase
VHRLVALDAHGSEAFVGALRQAWDDGDAVLPVDPRLPAPARARLLAAARLDEPVDDGDALVVATSGSAGEPKLAVLTHDAVAAAAQATSDRLGVDPGTDRWLACLPLAHVGGLGVVTRALLTGTPLVLHDGFEATAVEQAARDGATLVSLVATALRRVDAALFRRVVLGGDAPPTGLPSNVVATYGLTETGGGIAYDGVPLDGVEVRVGADGEVEVRGPMLLRCYRDGRDPKGADAWLPTGDVGAIDGDGRLVVHGRRGDVIVTGGEKVWPSAVEAVLATHPDVDEVMVIGREDPEWGQRVVAVVVPADTGSPPSLDALRDHVKTVLPGYSAPRDLELVRALPRSPLGKVRRGRG